jgi:hypothetical protein
MAHLGQISSVGHGEPAYAGATVSVDFLACTAGYERGEYSRAPRGSSNSPYFRQWFSTVDLPRRCAEEAVRCCRAVDPAGQQLVARTVARFLRSHSPKEWMKAAICLAAARGYCS